MISKNLIQKLIKISKGIIKDSSVENGAIVAANTDKIYYPRRGANYRWVWPRDAAFVCLAAHYLKTPSIYRKFFQWLLERPQDFKQEGLIYANYATNGRFGSMGKIFEPDQMGTTLWVIYQIFSQNNRRLTPEIRELIKRIADGLCSHWQRTNFSLHIVDLWEEVYRQTTLTMENNFTYSLAACAQGLLCADRLMSTPLWKETALGMIKEIDEAYQPKAGYFYRNVGKIKDKNIDASLIGLAWPFEIYKANDKRIVQTIKKIEENLVINGGVHRYQFDYFDSEGVAGEGGGGWPVLNFWLAIYWALAGNRERALKYYQWPLERVEKNHYYLPEQIFEDFRVSVYPLVWSHAMFIIASKYLGYIK